MERPRSCRVFWRAGAGGRRPTYIQKKRYSSVKNGYALDVNHVGLTFVATVPKELQFRSTIDMQT